MHKAQARLAPSLVKKETAKQIKQVQSGQIGNQALLSMLGADSRINPNSGRTLQLEDSLKQRLENHFGHSVDNIHFKESGEADKLGANAFAKGDTVHFAPGMFNQHTSEGQARITHELSHVMQQAKGEVHPSFADSPLSLVESFESSARADADSLGTASQSAVLAPMPTMSTASAPIQAEGFWSRRRAEKAQKRVEERVTKRSDEYKKSKMGPDAGIGHWSTNNMEADPRLVAMESMVTPLAEKALGHKEEFSRYYNPQQMKVADDTSLAIKNLSGMSQRYNEAKRMKSYYEEELARQEGKTKKSGTKDSTIAYIKQKIEALDSEIEGGDIFVDKILNPQFKPGGSNEKFSQLVAISNNIKRLYHQADGPAESVFDSRYRAIDMPQELKDIQHTRIQGAGVKASMPAGSFGTKLSIMDKYTPSDDMPVRVAPELAKPGHQPPLVTGAKGLPITPQKPPVVPSPQTEAAPKTTLDITPQSPPAVQAPQTEAAPKATIDIKPQTGPRVLDLSADDSDMLNGKKSWWERRAEKKEEARKKAAAEKFALALRQDKNKPVPKLEKGYQYMRNKHAYRKDKEYQDLRAQYQAYESATDEKEKAALHAQITERGNSYLKQRTQESNHKGRAENVRNMMAKLGTHDGGDYHYGEDVVYGLNDGRTKCVDRLLNGNAQTYRFGMIQNDLTNQVWDKDEPTRMYSDEEIHDGILRERPELVHNPEYVDKMQKRTSGFRDFLSRKAQSKPQYNVWQDFDRSRDEKSQWTQRWTRTSKAGLEYQMKALDKPVYFSTEGVDLKHVIKTPDKTDSSTHSGSVTSGELRWLYRHKDDEQVRKNLRLRGADGANVAFDDFFGMSDTDQGKANREQWGKYDSYRQKRTREKQGE